VPDIFRQVNHRNSADQRIFDLIIHLCRFLWSIIKLNASNRKAWKRLLNIAIVISVLLFNTLPLCATEKYVSIDRFIYDLLEYNILMQDTLHTFVMHQPYKTSDINPSFSQSAAYNSRNADNLNADEGLSLIIKPGFEVFSDQNSTNIYPVIYSDGFIKIGNFIGVNRLYASRALSEDDDFHGDTGEWVAAYFLDAYALYVPNKNLTLFAGRTSMNVGIPNEYGLFLSNNPYPYDLFGFTAKGKRLQYSWRTGRLNDMVGIDDAGVVIPLGETSQTNRFLAFQRLDLQISKTFQIGISEAALYGGPGQSFSGAYLNPMNFYYLSQRNQIVLMNGAWQINAFLLKPKRWGLYIDFYIDDFIINNDADIDDRSAHPDRLALMTKLSIPDLVFPFNLSSIRYVRVWNETYVTYRNYENWLYFDKGLGYPKRSYEGIKFQSSYHGIKHWQIITDVELWRHGDRSLYTTLFDTANIEFPAEPVIRGLDINSEIHIFYQNYDANLCIGYTKYSTQDNSRSSTFNVMIGVNYRFTFVY
jgi:hypothetical protein